MNKKYLISWILRGLGVVAVLGYFFGARTIADLFPGLIGQSLSPLFYAGLLLYIAGAVYYRILFSKERKEREKSKLEELRKASSAEANSKDDAE